MQIYIYIYIIYIYIYSNLEGFPPLKSAPCLGLVSDNDVISIIHHGIEGWDLVKPWFSSRFPLPGGWSCFFLVLSIHPKGWGVIEACIVGRPVLGFCFR